MGDSCKKIKYMNAVTVVKIIAALLITNSHFDGLYPSGMSALATGGMIGNALFFFISGYTLYFSINRITNKKDCLAWFSRRVFRIYPSVWIFSILLLTVNHFADLGGFASIHIKDFFITKYWFINAIIVCYILYFFILRSKSWKNVILVLIPVSYVILFLLLLLMHKNGEIGFIIEDIEGKNIWFRYVYLFQVMLWGGLYASVLENVKVPTKKQILSNICISIIAILVYYEMKFLCISYDVYYLQVLVPVCLTWVVASFWQFVSSIDYSNIGYKTGEVLKYLSGLTLDIYIVQFVLIWLFEKVGFPVGFVGAVFSIMLASMLLNYISKLISEWMIKVINLKIK